MNAFLFAYEYIVFCSDKKCFPLLALAEAVLSLKLHLSQVKPLQSTAWTLLMRK